MSDDGTKLAATTSGGLIYLSVDSGLTWIEQADSGIGNWSSITMSGDGAMIAAAMNGGHISTATVVIPPVVVPPNPPTPTPTPTPPVPSSPVVPSTQPTSSSDTGGLAATGTNAQAVGALSAIVTVAGALWLIKSKK